MSPHYEMNSAAMKLKNKILVVNYDNHSFLSNSNLTIALFCVIVNMLFLKERNGVGLTRIASSEK